MTIKALIKKSHKMAKEKGFWKRKINIGERIALLHSELSEMLEADRENKYIKGVIPDKIFNQIKKSRGEKFIQSFNVQLKGHFEMEIADVFLRLGDLCGGLDINIVKYIEMKMKYNKTRKKLHGKKY